ncbi:hypothetical protein KP509_08G008300 [Ceratopteris richardii]|uniref:ADP-ribosyl cyclase/cyclic ADP-ribose hydrolase n=1 Tax=Ceratopteris richardii TaxID=49495 RepID=A0A8T2UBK2_CERRI|nr:hypothetical protein KP509_08G008300 [Ceratopteris richardii]
MPYRGPDSKQNIVSVLSGMLNSKCIKSFVDYQIKEGAHIHTEIYDAIQISSVYIVILSSRFANSKYCREEVVEIMKAHDATAKPHQLRKVITVLYDMEPVVAEEDTSYGLPNWNWSAVKRKDWKKAYERLLGCAEKFECNSKTTLLWEKLEEIVKKVQDFLDSNKLISVNCMEIGISRECWRAPHDVFICHCGEDTKHNVVSVLRGMLVSNGIGCFAVGFQVQDGESELKPDTKKIIKNSKVRVVFLSPNFVRSKECLEEVVQIMDTNGTSGTSDQSKPTTIPIFYDVDPSVFRLQAKGSAYDVQTVQEGTDQEREEWSKALKSICDLKGKLYRSSKEYLWEFLHHIFKRVAECVMDIGSCNDHLISGVPYKEKID